MSTKIRPEVSVRNPYWIHRHRYYELKHFCLQYSEWRKLYANIDIYARRKLDPYVATSNISDPTAFAAMAKSYFSERMTMVENASKMTDPVIGLFIFKAVTEGLSYDTLRTKYNIPCGKDYYYELYRKFFWLLSASRK